MDARSASDPTPPTTTTTRSEREVVVTRTFAAPARVVFDAWTQPALLQRWWAPRSMNITFVSCEADVRTGGTYRFVFAHPSAPEPMAFFGRYLEVTPPVRLVWTNEEGEGGAVTTVTFEEQGGKTQVVVRDVYPSKQALDDAIAAGSVPEFDEAFTQLDELLAR